MTRCAADLLPPGAVLVEATPEMWDEPPFPEEAPFLAAASTERRREFGAGRACARRALAALGFPPIAIPVGPSRVPAWPAGVVGSISHTRGLCLAAVAPSTHLRGLGIDAERRHRLERELVSRVCTPGELARLDENGADRDTTLVFSAKESFFKCVFPFAGVRFDFLDVEISIDPRRRSLLGRLLAPRESHFELHGRYAIDHDYLVTAFCLT